MVRNKKQLAFAEDYQNKVYGDTDITPPKKRKVPKHQATKSKATKEQEARAAESGHESTEDAVKQPSKKKPRSEMSTARIKAPNANVLDESRIDDDSLEVLYFITDETLDGDSLKRDSDDAVLDLSNRLPILKARDLGAVTCPVFRHICEKLFADDYYTDIIQYLDAVTVTAAWAFQNSQIQSNMALKRVVEEDLWDDSQALCSVDGKFDVRGDQQGWYGAISLDAKDPDYMKVYIGQGWVRARRDAHLVGLAKAVGSLFWSIAGKPGRHVKFVLLGVWSSAAKVPYAGALLNPNEMHWSSLFQSLPPQSLKKWLPNPVTLRPERGLNVALPLNQTKSKHGAARREFFKLKYSTDAEVRQYWSDKQTAALKKVNDRMRDLGHKPVSDALRKSSEKVQVHCRDPLSD